MILDTDDNNLDPGVNYFDTQLNCASYSGCQINDQFKHNNTLNFIHVNIRSARRNFDEFLLSLSSLTVHFAVVVLTETWLDDSAEWQDVAGYNAFHAVRSSRTGGGVTVLVDSRLESEQIAELSLITDSYEACTVKIKDSKSESHMITGVYRPPNASLTMFNANFFQILGHAELNSSRSACLGDFNVDIGTPEPSEAVASFISLFQSCHYISVITEPTRVTSRSATCLDHIWINSVTAVKSGVWTISVSDHFPVFVCLPYKPSMNEFRKIKFRIHSPGNVDRLIEAVKYFIRNFSSMYFTDIHAKCAFLCEGIFKLYSKFCPIATKMISAKRLSKPWLTPRILRIIDHKHQLSKLKCRGLVSEVEYKQFRNYVTSSIRTSKYTYYDRMFARSMGDCRATWKNINGILRPNTSKSLQYELHVDNEVVTNRADVAHLFNKYFTSVADELKAKIPPTNSDPLQYVPLQPSSFAYLPCSADEIISIVNLFKNKKCDINSVPVFIYKSLCTTIASALTDVINESLFVGTCPNNLKVARVIPLFKKGTRNCPSNFRPISTLHFVNKIFEKVMNCRLKSYLDRFGIISPQQFGFVRNRATSDAILRLTDEIYGSFDAKQYFIGVMLDFSKAFDTVQHDILLAKLEKIGIRGSVLDWFKSYLTDRQQYVDIDGVPSGLLPVNTGVPQGSILGPLLFNLYINDMHRCSSNLSFIHFADDTTIFVRGDNLVAVTDSLNSELNSVDEWLKMNKLSLNISKSSFMIFSNLDTSSSAVIKIRGTDLIRVSRAKFLGMSLDDKLNFRDHIDSVCNKVSKSCGVIRRLSFFVPCHVLKLLYSSFVLPYLTYCIEVWGSSNKVKLARLDRIQTRAVSYFSCVHGRADFAAAGLLPLEHLFMYRLLVKFYQYTVLGSSDHFRVRFTSLIPGHEYGTRYRTDRKYNVPNIRISKLYSSFYYSAVACWNRLPIDIRSSSNINLFKKYAKNYLLHHVL